MLDDIARIESDAAPRITAAESLDDLHQLELELLGKKSEFTALKSRLGGLDPDDRRAVGGAINRLREVLDSSVAARRAELEAVARRRTLDAERMDLTEVGPGAGAGHLHLVTQAMERLEDVFVGMGFTVSEGPEVETDWNNFGALNFPPDHPARDMYDTLYVEMGAPGSTVLRTHTSPVQVRVMNAQPPPIYSVMPGRVYRQDTPDATHMPVFHQIEGLVIDRGITFADLAGTIDAFTKAFFGGDFSSRLRPSYFPFTEPSAEFDIRLPDGSWLELGGCGMVHPNVLENCGIDPEEWQGFAFGFGLDRLGASAHGVTDLRDLFTNDIRFLEQFLKVTLSWLRDFAPFDGRDPVALGEVMSDLGMAVEELVHVGEGLDGVVVARVLETRPIEGANKIHLVVVDAGDGQPLEVGCGAFNMSAGDLVPLATVGTVMPSGLEIGRRKMAGVVSNGMLCSSVELGLGDDQSGILLLPSHLEPGTPFREAMGIERDVVYDLEINPNRPDAMSVAGVARDLAARLGLPFALPEASVSTVPADAITGVSVEIVDPDRCGRFEARVLRGVQVGPGDPMLARRLAALGMRSINNVVDVSNYVMLELGQPNHPYDLAKVAGPGFRVRCAREGESLVTLDEVERRLTPADLLICGADDVPVGLAGIMGGGHSEISLATTDVLLEMAWFHPIGIVKSSRRHKLRSEASARFEKGTDPEIIDLAMRRFAQLLAPSGAHLEQGAATADGELPPVRPVVRVRRERVCGVLGTDLGTSRIAELLDPIGFTTTAHGDDLDVTIPTWRYDSGTEIDVIEEVARHHGYSALGRTVPKGAGVGGLTVRQRERRGLRRALTGRGLSEAMPLPFLAPGELSRCGLPDDGITIANPLVAEQSVLRTALLPGLVGAVAYNWSHRNHGVRLFEIGHVFRRGTSSDAELPDERECLGVVLAGQDAAAAVELWWALAEALGLADVRLDNAELAGLHPTRGARIVVGDLEVGAVGEIDPGVLDAHDIAERVGYLEVDLDALLAQPHGEAPYRPFSLFPSSDIDLAFEVDDATPAVAVEAAIRSSGTDLLWSVRLFDTYRGPGVAGGRRSLAYRLRLQAADRTLTDADVADVRSSVIDAVESTLPATLRG